MSHKITVIGTRGIPHILGGVESHCQNLYPLITSMSDNKVCVIARSPYVSVKQSEYKEVQVKSLFAPKKKALEAIFHSVWASLNAWFDGSDIVHVHSIGPGLVAPLLRLMGKKVVFTHHGPDYDRQKWGGFAKKVLEFGEKMAITYASEVIVISDVINQLIKDKYQRHDAHLIYNGVVPAIPLSESVIADILSPYHLTPKNYIVAVGRFVEEKGFHDLIQAYKQSGQTVPLVIVGDADHPTTYSDELKRLASETPNVILTGFLSGDALQAIFSQARLFVMPSYHEGLPIALLEAMSYGLPVYLSDIPANAEVALDPEVYFPVGNVADLTQKLTQLPTESDSDYSAYLPKYDWGHIAQQTLSVYQECRHKEEHPLCA